MMCGWRGIRVEEFFDSLDHKTITNTSRDESSIKIGELILTKVA